MHVVWSTPVDAPTNGVELPPPLRLVLRSRSDR